MKLSCLWCYGCGCDYLSGKPDVDVVLVVKPT